MTNTIRKQLVSAMIAAFIQIPGIVTACRQRDTDAEPFAPEECPALNIIDESADTTPDLSQDRHALPVEVDIITTGSVTADDIEAIAADVLATVAANPRWGNLANGSAAAGHWVRVRQSGDTVTNGGVRFTVYYTTPQWGL